MPLRPPRDIPTCRMSRISHPVPPRLERAVARRDSAINLGSRRQETVSWPVQRADSRKTENSGSPNTNCRSWPTAWVHGEPHDSAVATVTHMARRPFPGTVTSRVQVRRSCVASGGGCGSVPARSGLPPAARPCAELLFPHYSLDSDQQWGLRYLRYASVSRANATAFSPAGAPSLTEGMKLLTAMQSTAALIASAVVFARSVNILGT